MAQEVVEYLARIPYVVRQAYGSQHSTAGKQYAPQRTALGTSGPSAERFADNAVGIIVIAESLNAVAMKGASTCGTQRLCHLPKLLCGFSGFRFPTQRCRSATRTAEDCRQDIRAFI